MADLRRIAADTRLNFYRDQLINTGYMTPDKEGFFCFGDQKFTTRTDIPETSCHPGDKARLLEAVKAAKKECDYVFIVVHCHDNDHRREENPADYMVEFCRACVDAGVSAVFGGGCHRLRPLEIYKGVPIFYSLGDFIYQGLRIEHLPADFMEKYGIDIYSSAEEALWTRSRGGKVGLHCDKPNYQSVLPKLEFEDGRLTSLTMMPLYLNFHRKDRMNGLPAMAQGDEAKEIFDLYSALSAPLGSTLQITEDNLFAVK